ncbi:hypothetical protein F7Q99_15075 [Streptomyces kaniharaensis]|uniref:Uncharacterized protein n=1 Tax=Streptomyces kaniharaensis TaxID=212423 RepID=A0A6N7KU56_9ACTN|nr:hypothetical protein [Streptomyces kaniharaensis]MQS13554.1 hypothetical protein [Streptomyces kaniharaensis]
MTHDEMSRRENRQLAAASATVGPWRTAAGVGAVVGATALGINAISGNWSLSMLAGPAGWGLFFFFLVGTVGGQLRRDTGDRRLRRWADEHPWKAALPAAGGLLVLNMLAQMVLGDAGLFGAFFESLIPAGVLLAIAGVVGSVKQARGKG